MPDDMSQDIKEIKSTLSDLRVAIAELPQMIFDKADERYAAKAVETEILNLRTQQSNRTYDWLKTSALLIITIVLTLIFGKYTHIGL